MIGSTFLKDEANLKETLMIFVPFILTLQQEAQLKPLQVKERFSVALSAANQLTKIGNLSATKAVKTFSVEEMFSPKRAKDFNCIFEKDTGRYWMLGTFIRLRKV